MRQFNLDAELQDFLDIVRRMKDAHARTGQKTWLLVIVNKADLFFERLNDAQTYYHQGTPGGFANAVNDIIQNIGVNSFRYESIPVSSWHEDFKWNTEVQTSRLNDGETRALFMHMRDRINDMTKWWVI